MGVLARFSTPGHLVDANADAWHERIAPEFGAFATEFEQFYDPTATDTPANAAVVRVLWPASPGRLVGQPDAPSLADSSRLQQDEYCEWGVERNADGKITRVTFTSEVPEYFEHLFATAPDELLSLYREFVDPDVEPNDLGQNGSYVRDNTWNGETSRRPAHLIQGSNNLGAAVRLAAEATVLFERDGVRVVGNEQLVLCGELGDPRRHSDPSIAGTINGAAAAGDEITLNDPPGLYIDGLITGGMATPDGADPGLFWLPERGSPGHTVRAVYEVPEDQDRDYTVGDITIRGRPIEFGAQLALHVRVRIDALVKPANHDPVARPCGT